MNYSGNHVASANLRTEIAIAQEPINAYTPGIVKFKIPALMSDATSETIINKRNNIVNKDTKFTTSIGATETDNTISLRVPKEYTRWYGRDILPKGTRFIVAYIAGNINDIKIIARYDSADD